jgi:hypothetical protein
VSEGWKIDSGVSDSETAGWLLTGSISLEPRLTLKRSTDDDVAIIYSCCDDGGGVWVWMKDGRRCGEKRSSS